MSNATLVGRPRILVTYRSWLTLAWPVVGKNICFSWLDGFDILVHCITIYANPIYIQFKMQANSWLTLRWLLWSAFLSRRASLEKTHFTKPAAGCRTEVSISLSTGINIIDKWLFESQFMTTFDCLMWFQKKHYRKCLQRRKSRRISICLRIKRASGD